MRIFGLCAAALAVASFVSGCGYNGPKQAPIAPPEKIAKKPADADLLVEEVEVEVDVEEEMPADGESSANTEDAATPEEGDAAGTETADAEAEAPAEEPAEPKPPRSSVFLKLLAQPLQDAMQANLESLGQGTGQF